jgi:hypothetical protein
MERDHLDGLERRLQAALSSTLRQNPMTDPAWLRFATSLGRVRPNVPPQEGSSSASGASDPEPGDR